MKWDLAGIGLGRFGFFLRMCAASMAIMSSLSSTSCVQGAEAAKKVETDKTLVTWVALANLNQQGGSALTVQRGDEFDGIVLGERVPGKWMAGSDCFHRTQGDQNANPTETAGSETLVQVAIVYQGDEIRLYRNGRPYAVYKARNIDLLGADDHIAVFGLRHVGADSGTALAGSIEDARVYGRALSAREIQSLRLQSALRGQALGVVGLRGEDRQRPGRPLLASRAHRWGKAPGRAARAERLGSPGRCAIGSRCPRGGNPRDRWQPVASRSHAADVSPDQSPGSPPLRRFPTSRSFGRGSTTCFSSARDTPTCRARICSTGASTRPSTVRCAVVGSS